MHGETIDKAAARDEWRKGWPMVLASCAGMSVTAVTLYTMGIFMPHIEKEFGWSRAFISASLSVNAVMGVIFSAFVGALIDRVGPRRVAIPGILVYCISLGLLATATGSQVQWLAIWFGIALGSLLLKPTVWTWAVVSRFDAARGMALAVALSGSAVTGMIAPFAATYFIGAFGWQGAYAALALSYVAIVLPLVVLFFFGATELANKRSGGLKARASGPPPTLPGMTMRQAFASLTYWKLAIATFLVMLTITGGIVHLVPILIQGGLGAGAAAAAAGAIGVSAFLGRLAAGFLLDRMNARILGSLGFVLPALVAAGLLAFNGSLPMAICLALLLGLCTGAELEISSYLTSKHFGLRSFGALFGFIAGLIAFASGIGAPLAGLAFDMTDSYDLALLGALGLSLAAGLLLFTLPDIPGKAAAPAEA